MTQEVILSREQVAGLFKFQPSEIIEVRSYYGEKSLFCRQCYGYHAPSFRVRGRYTSSANELVIADIWMSAEGHVLADDSH